jgi:hypothetical protein
MGCISSKAFKGEGHRLGTAATASTAAPPNAGGPRIAPTTAVSKHQAANPTNNTSGSGTDGNMRSAAARAAEQRAESVSLANVLSPDQPTWTAQHFCPTQQSLTSFYSKYEEGRTLRIQMPESYPTSCRNKIGRRRYPSHKGMSDLPCVPGALACSYRLA